MLFYVLVLRFIKYLAEVPSSGLAENFLALDAVGFMKLRVELAVARLAPEAEVALAPAPAGVLLFDMRRVAVLVLTAPLLAPGLLVSCAETLENVAHNISTLQLPLIEPLELPVGGRAGPAEVLLCVVDAVGGTHPAAAAQVASRSSWAPQAGRRAKSPSWHSARWSYTWKQI